LVGRQDCTKLGLAMLTRRGVIQMFAGKKVVFSHPKGRGWEEEDGTVGRREAS